MFRDIIAFIDRMLGRDLAGILSTFDRVEASLESFMDREQARIAKDKAKVQALYDRTFAIHDRIDDRRMSIGRAQAVATNIRQLTASE
jgi:hypothetical protein